MSFVDSTSVEEGSEFIRKLRLQFLVPSTSYTSFSFFRLPSSTHLSSSFLYAFPSFSTLSLLVFSLYCIPTSRVLPAYLSPSLNTYFFLCSIQIFFLLFPLLFLCPPEHTSSFPTLSFSLTLPPFLSYLPFSPHLSLSHTRKPLVSPGCHE